MAYATQADISNRYGNDALVLAADRDGDGTPDAGVVDGALQDASELMDSYIGVKYGLPLTAVPAVLVQRCVDIALYQMSQSAGPLTDEVRTRYQDALRWLRDLADGRVQLGLEQSPPTAGGGAVVMSQPRRFSRDTLKGL